MEKTKLILLLKSLDEGEMKRLRSFLASEYFNTDEDIRRLFELLRGFHPHFSDPQLNKKEIFGRLYPGQTYHDKSLRYLMSHLNKLAEQFLGLQKIEEQPFRLKLALLEELSRRGLDKSYRQIDRRLAKELQDEQGGGGDLYLARYRWAEVKEQHFERQRLRRYDENIQHTAAQLDRFYYLQRLRFSCAMLDRQRILQARYQLNLSDDWIRHLEAQDFFGEPAIRLYYTIYRALAEEDEESCFVELKKGIAEEGSKMPLKDLRDIYLFAINYCARKIRQGNTAYVKEARQLYRSGIEEGILIEEGVLSPWAFTNMVKLSLRMEQYGGIERFIEQYAPLLPEAFRENALHYNLAELYYYTRRFEQAQEQLLRVALTDLNYYLGARVLLIKIYYENGAEEALLSLLASFIIFLKRNKQLSTHLKHTYLNFCQLLFQIVRRPPDRLETICKRIKSTELLTDRAWLEETCRKAMGN